MAVYAGASSNDGPGTGSGQGTLIHRPGAINLWGPRYPGLTAGIPVPPQATADLSAMSTETLIDEMERLVKRVQDRDAKFYKRMRYPYGHAHPMQYWPMVSECYKAGSLTLALYARPSDFLMVIFWSAWMYIITCCRCRRQYPFNFWLMDCWQGADNRWTLIPKSGLGPRSLAYFWAFLEIGWRSWHVEARLYGLDENSYEIEKYGPMYPDEIALAARRKEKYEQEYMRIREGFQNYKEWTDKADRPCSYFANSKVAPYAPGGAQMSGYWQDEEAGKIHEKLRQEAAERRREKTGYVE